MFFNLPTTLELQILKKRIRFLYQNAEQYKNTNILHTSELNGKLFIAQPE